MNFFLVKQSDLHLDGNNKLFAQTQIKNSQNLSKKMKTHKSHAKLCRRDQYQKLNENERREIPPK